MKRDQIEEYIVDNGLLKDCLPQSGIYAITIDNIVVYIGQSKNVYQRCSQHIYNIENAALNKEQKYLLLLSAKLGGHKIDCMSLEYCNIESLNEKENFWIAGVKPCLNILTPYGKQDISKLKIEDVLKVVNDKWEELKALWLSHE